MPVPRVKAELDCPRCSERHLQDVELRFARTAEQASVELGGYYPWLLAFRPSSQVKAGNATGLAWTICSGCRMDFFVLADIRDDRLTSLRVDTEQLPSYPDGLLQVQLRCGRHGEAEHEVALSAGVGRDPDPRYALGDPYEVGAKPGVNTRFRARATCVGDKVAPHEVFVLVDAKDGVLFAVTLDPNQARTSVEYFTAVLFP